MCVYQPIQAHNENLDVFLDLELLGLIFLFLLISRTYRKTANALEEKGETNKLLFVFLIMILLHNFTESALAKPTNLIWFLFLLTSIFIRKTITSDEESQKSHARHLLSR
jgi:O-antigen ligase